MSGDARRHVESARNRLEVAHESIGRALDAAEEASAVMGQPDGSRKKRRQGLAREVLTVLQQEEQSVTALAARLGHARGAVGTALLGLMRDGVAERVGKGRYRAVPQASKSGTNMSQIFVDFLHSEIAQADTRIEKLETSLSLAREDAARLKAMLRKVTPQRPGPRWHSAERLIEAASLVERSARP